MLLSQNTERDTGKRERNETGISKTNVILPGAMEAKVKQADIDILIGEGEGSMLETINILLAALLRQAFTGEL